MADSIRQGIMDDLLTAVMTIDEVHGAVDDLPPANIAEPPPRPRIGYGVAQRPFAFVVDGIERPIGDDTTAMYDCSLPIEVAIIYPFSRVSGAEGCKYKGRRLLAKLQAALMVDPNRGLMTEPSDDSERKRAMNTVEDENDVGVGDEAESLGVVVWRGHVDYVRGRKDPTSAEGT